MKITLYYSHPEDLTFFADLPCPCQVLFESQETSYGKGLALADLHPLAKKSSLLGLRPILLWDTLMTENQLDRTLKSIKSEHLKHFSAIRVLDPGAARWIFDNLAEMPIELIVENSSLNMTALQSWCELFGPRLVTLALGIQAGDHFPSECSKQLPGLNLELLGAGPLLGLRSARRLLSPLLHATEDVVRSKAKAVSLEDPSIKLMIEQHQTGTAVYFDQDLFILDQPSLLENRAIHSFRIDARNITDREIYCRTIESMAKALAKHLPLANDLWPFPSAPYCFEKGVASHLYRELKSKRQLSTQNSCIAEVVAVQSEQWFALLSKQKFVRQGKYSLLWPSGELIGNLVMDLETIDGKKPELIEQEKLVINFGWVKGICPGTQLLA